MTKQAVREQFLAHRKALSPTTVEDGSQRITDQFLHWLSTADRLPTYTTIHVFLPILRQHEVNTWPIIHALWQHYPSVQLVASVTDFVTHSMTHYPLTDSTVLLTNKGGIPEPSVGIQSAIDSQQIDIVLLPLLGFDQQGQRVGYGGGFYDRFLADCRADCLKIGLSLIEPIVQITATEPTDIKMNQCITPTQIWQFSC